MICLIFVKNIAFPNISPVFKYFYVNIYQPFGIICDTSSNCHAGITT